MSTKQETAFRIGGVYRNQGGKAVRLFTIPIAAHSEKWHGAFPGHEFALARDVSNRDACGYVSLMSGQYVKCMDGAQNEKHLLPGELHEVNGEWVPISAKPAMAAHVGDLPTYVPQALEAAYKAMERAFGMKDAPDCVAVHTDLQPAPLPYFAEQQERARFDSFREFCTTSSSSDPNHYRGSFGSPDLQKAEHQVSPMFGSAFLSRD